jgi:hypothetical protein
MIKNYQLHPASATTQHHNGSKKKTKKTNKQKIPLRYSGPDSNSTTTIKTTLELQTLQKRRLHEGNSAQAPSSLDQRS